MLFIVRDDVKVTSEKLLSYLEPKVKSLIILARDNQNNIIKESSNLAPDLLNLINTPGVLTAGDDDLVSDADDVRLTVSKTISETNRNRASNGGLKALKENSKLNISAQIKLNDMFNKQYFEHVSPLGVGVSDLGNKVNYDYLIIGENLALGNFKDETALLDAWMASPGHRANILNDNYSEIGIAVGRGVYNGENIWMAVQHFGLPKNACPVINDVLKGIIDIEQKNVDSMSTELAKLRSNIDKGVVYQGMTVNEQINKYNLAVADYNKFIANIKQKISEYNNSVKSFNDCLSESLN